MDMGTCIFLRKGIVTLWHCFYSQSIKKKLENWHVKTAVNADTVSY